MTPQERFWSKVAISEFPSMCWPWLAGKTAGGYGHFGVNYKMKYAHRIAYESAYGAIPAVLEIDHLCRNRACCNPSHLEPVTTKENFRRGDGMKRAAARAAKTHCPQGHEYTPDNLYFQSEKNRGGRMCKTCTKARSRAARARAKGIQ